GGFTASALLYQLLIRLNRDEANIAGGREKVNHTISDVLSYISENYTATITLENLCEAAGGLSEQYLCRLFKQSTGMRPMEYILKKRISAARSYLENTDMPISEIAVLTGFHNTSYFYRNFKKFTGMSPLVCRQNAYGKAVSE
ncbi:MAG: helix-turn-helix transcriptional regulator, partial [Clostridia bacterium]|nr:helix-turn-helix transcriptional regulator [Clostridia bacterium]